MANLDKQIVDILVRKIKDAEINPKTNEPFKVSDIKMVGYRDAVENTLNQVRA